PPSREGDLGRGPLPAELARFEGVETGETSAVLRYQRGGSAIREWFKLESAPTETRYFRHLEIAAHTEPLHFALGTPVGSNWERQPARSATAINSENGYTRFATNTDVISLSVHHGELVAT